MELSYWISRREQPELLSVHTLSHTSLTEALWTSEVIQNVELMPLECGRILRRLPGFRGFCFAGVPVIGIRIQLS